MHVSRGLELRINLALLDVFKTQAGGLNQPFFFFVDLLLWHLFPPNIEMYYLFYYSVLGWVRYLPKILVVREPTLELSYEADTMAALHSSLEWSHVAGGLYFANKNVDGGELDIIYGLLGC